MAKPTLGELVRASHVARVLGLAAKTVRKYVRSGVWAGRVVNGRVYVLRSVFEAVRDGRPVPVRVSNDE